MEENKNMQETEQITETAENGKEEAKEELRNQAGKNTESAKETKQQDKENRQEKNTEPVNETNPENQKNGKEKNVKSVDETKSENQKNKTKESKDKKKKEKRIPWTMIILTVVSVILLIGTGCAMGVMDYFEIWGRDKNGALREEMALLMDRYSIYALCDYGDDYNMPEIQKTNLHMGIFKSDEPDIYEEVLADPNNYVIHNFDENFDYKNNVHIFQTYIDPGTHFSFDMANIWGFARVTHDRNSISVSNEYLSNIAGFYYDWMTDTLYIETEDNLYRFDGICVIPEDEIRLLGNISILKKGNSDNIAEVADVTNDEYYDVNVGISANLDSETHASWINENLTVALAEYNYRIPFNEITIIQDMDLRSMKPVIVGELEQIGSGRILINIAEEESVIPVEEEVNSDRVYYTVVSYLNSPLENRAKAVNDLFLEADRMIRALYSWKYVILAAFIISCALGCFCALFWFIKCMLFLLKVIGRIRIVWKAVLVLAAGAFILFCFAASGEPEAMVVIFVGYILFICPAVLYIVWEYRKQMITCEKLAEGNLEARVDTKHMIWDLKRQGETLNTISEGINKAVDEQLKSERMKAELVTNVSHDIKTPLTSIINYVDLLSREEIESEKAREYIEVLNRQSDKLKKLIVDLIEVSKASTGNLDIHAELCDARMALLQVVGEYEEKLKDNKITLILNAPEEKAMIMADGRYLFRIFDNLMQNIRKYALENTRAYIDLMMVDESVILIFKNISRDSLNVSGEEFAERFYRGDSSRNTEGNGLGLAIVKSLAELMNGTVTIIVDGDLFKVEVRFPKAE